MLQANQLNPQVWARKDELARSITLDSMCFVIRTQMKAALEGNGMASASPEHDPETCVSVCAQSIRKLTSSTDTDGLRTLLCGMGTVIDLANAALSDLQACQAGISSTRKGFLRSLEDQIGPPIKRTWEDELRCAWSKLFQWSESVSDEYTSGETEETRERMEETISQNKGDMKRAIQGMQKVGWGEDTAKMFQALSWPRPRLAIGRGLRTGDNSFSACTYTICAAMYQEAERQCTSGMKAPKLYRHLHGRFSLSSLDPSWGTIQQADMAGFRGLTSTVLVKARFGGGSGDTDNCFCEEGFQQWIYDTQSIETQDSDIVCFESAPPSVEGRHSAIVTEGTADHPTHGAFPPNTLYTLKRIEEAGQWQCPAGIRINQRLLVVTATYRAPNGRAADGSASRKLCGSTTTLQYGDRAAYIAGLDDIIARPILTIKLEFDRDFKWVDWRGIEYDLRTEWAYVTGPARRCESCTPGIRDDCNEGKTLSEFEDAVNSCIRKRRRAATKHNRCHLEEGCAYLSTDEVRAVRLYSGPAYQPINDFLRQVAKLTGSHRAALAQHVGLSFAATVGHLTAAIRKLAAAATAEETALALFRGVRGELPRSFWIKDAMGMVCATDTAFMSTSRSRPTTINYMSADESNVLWELQPAEEDDSGYHCGADISLLSQFGHEEEVLFPPCCLLKVAVRADTQATLRDATATATGSSMSSQAGKHFVAIEVRPTFA
jgi:hypothetical protein